MVDLAPRHVPELRLARVARGWTLHQVARAIGATAGALSERERGLRRLPAEQERRLRELYAEGRAGREAA